MSTKKILLKEEETTTLISQLSALVSDLIRGVSGAPNKIFTWISSHIGLSIGGIKQYFVNIWSTIESSNNVFMKVIHYIGSAIGTAINYVVNLLAPLVANVKSAMSVSIPGLTGVTCGQLIVCTVILASITFVIYKIYKKLKNRSSKRQSQFQTPQEVVKESKAMLRDTMEAITEGVNTFKCCDKLIEGVNIQSRAGIAANMVAKSGKMCCELYSGLFGKNRTEGFNIFEGDNYDRESSRPSLLKNKKFMMTALLCIAVVLGFFSFNNFLNGVGSIFQRAEAVNTPTMIREILRVITSPKVMLTGGLARIAYDTSKQYSTSNQMEPTREYR